MTISSKNCKTECQSFQRVANKPEWKRTGPPAKAIEQRGTADPSVETLFWLVFVYYISAFAFLAGSG
jgi:hypothetical protein